MASGKYPNKPGTGSTSSTQNTSSTPGTTGTTGTTRTSGKNDPGTTGTTDTTGKTDTTDTSSTNGGSGGQTTGPERFLVHIPVNAPSTSSTTADRKVDDLFRQVFRGKVPDKPAELIDKLNQVVRAKKVEGRAAPEFTYSPKPTGITKSIEGQSVAQTSLFERAHASLTDAEKRLTELRPMETPKDPQNLDALRAVTASTYKRLVNELGEGGGPRNKRALRLFDALIGKQEPDAEIKLGDDSLLKQIQDEFTLTGTASSPEDSANLANFRILKENLFDIFRGWGNFKGEIEGDFGSRAAKLARTFDLIQDDVADLEAVLDAVGYDASDRESDQLLPDVIESEKITVDGLLTWTREFAAEEGPEMLKDGGVTGVKATLPTFDELTALSAAMETKLKEKFIDSKSVKDSLKSLNERLGEAQILAYNIAGKELK